MLSTVSSFLNRSRIAEVILISGFWMVAHAISHAQSFATPVEVDEVSVESLNETVTVFGQLVSRQAGTVDVAISAPVSAIHVRIGDRVEQGDLIATLDSSVLELQRNAAKARAEVSSWRTKRIETELELAKQKEDRFRQLRHSAATTEAQHEDAVLLLQIARDALGEANASEQQVQRDLELANHNLSLTKITAPYGGVIVERFIEMGEYVQVGNRVVRILGDHDLEIEAYIPYRYVDALTVGDSIGAEFDNGTRFDATLRAFIPEEHVSTRTRAVRFEFDLGDSDQLLAINQNVIIDVPVSDRREALSVHKDAVITTGSGHMVFVVNGETVSPQPVTIGEATGNRYEVTFGLESGELVVIRGNERLQPGQNVEIINQVN